MIPIIYVNIMMQLTHLTPWAFKIMVVPRYEKKFKTEVRVRALILSINLNFRMRTKIKGESFKLVIFYFFSWLSLSALVWF